MAKVPVKRKNGSRPGVPRKPAIKKRGSRWPPRSKPSCLFCGKVFARFGLLVEHMTKHTKEKWWWCDQCDATFSFLTAKYVHRNSVHRGMTYECDQCSKVFKAPTNLSNHKRVDHKRKIGGVGVRKAGRPKIDRIGKVAKAKKTRRRRKLPVATKRRRKHLKKKDNNEDESTTETPRTRRSAALAPSQLLNLVKGLDRVANQRREGISGELVVEEAVGEVKKDDDNETEGTEIETIGLDSREIVEEGCSEITDVGPEEGECETGVDDKVGDDRLEPVEELSGCTESLENGTKMKCTEGDDNTSPTQDIGATSDKSFYTEDTEAGTESVPIIASKLNREDDETPISGIIGHHSPPGNFQDEQKVQLPANSEYPELVLVDPVTKAVTPFSSAPELPPSSNRDGIPEHPPNLFFSVNGQVVMPMFSLTVLQHLARRNSRLRSPSPSDRSSEEDEEEQPIKFQQPKRKMMKLPNRLKTAIVKGDNPNKPYECHLCGSSFAGACHLATHLKSHRNTGSGSFSCSFCASSYNSRSAIQYHVFAQHSESKNSAKPFACPFCLEFGNTRAFSDKLSFFRHIRVHFNQKRDKPGKESIKKPRLKGLKVPKSLPIPKPVLVKKQVAQSNLTSKGKHVCHVCNRGFEFPNKLAAHLNTHTGNKAWPCPLCVNRYYDRFQAAQHVAGAHSSVLPGQTGCACPFCDGSFEEKRDISSHIIRNHRDKFQNMPEVSKQESDVLPSSVKTHPKSSARGRNPKKTSALANSVFARKKVTQAIWKNKGKHVCHICNRGFKWSNRLTAHLNTHTGNRAWPCPLCDNRYYDRFQAGRHVAGAHSSVSTGQTKYSCPFCTDGNFEERRDINIHIIRNHKDKFQNIPEVSQQESDVLPSSVKTHPKSSARGRNPKKTSALANSVFAKKKVTQAIWKNKGKNVCHICNREFKWSSKLVAHLNSHTGNRTWPCPLCDKRYYDRFPAARHVAGAHSSVSTGPSRYSCPFCTDGSFEERHDINVHIFRNHRDKFQNIPEVSKQEPEVLSSSVTAHSRPSAEKPSHQENSSLAISNESVKKQKSKLSVELLKSKLKKIVRTRTSKKMAFKSKPITGMVPAENDSIIPHTCPQCDSKFRLKCHLARHLKFHNSINQRQQSEENTLPCQFCNCMYFIKSSLVRHIIARHCHGQQPDINASSAQCPFCAYQGNIKQPDKGLYKHIAQHLLQKAESPAVNPVNSIENATSTQKAVLKNSSRKRVALPSRKKAVNASRKPVQPNRKLNKNLKKLVQKKPFSCKVCKLSFRYPSKLADHAMMHTDERPFGCSLCSLRFRRKSNLVAHLITIHGKRVEPVATQNDLPATSFFCCLCLSPNETFSGNKGKVHQHIFQNHSDVLKRTEN